jgi:hypothetical protein
MPRRSTDLLDVFRSPPPPRRAAAPLARRRARAALLGAIGLLLVVLAVTATSALRRPGTAPESPSLLARVRRGEWILRSETPRVSSVGNRDLAVSIPRELVARFPDLAGRVRVAPGPTKQRIRVIVTGFRSRTEAERALATLSLWNLESSFPFRRAEVVEVE